MQGGRGLRHRSELCFAPFEIVVIYVYILEPIIKLLVSVI